MAESLHILLGTSACLQWLCHSGERTVACEPLVSKMGSLMMSSTSAGLIEISKVSRALPCTMNHGKLNTMSPLFFKKAWNNSVLRG